MIKKIVVLLPMKGNSERVPNKNLKIFNSKPLYHSIVNTLLESKYITDIIVNTDSEKIKKNIKESFPQIKIIDRPKEIQGDFISMNKIIANDILKIDSDFFLQTHSTNPLLKVSTIDKAIEEFFKNLKTYDSMFSVNTFQSRFFYKNNKPINHNPLELIRTQDLDPIYEENSNFYIFSRESFIKSNKNRIGMKPNLFPTDKIESIDIDDLNDFKIAESLIIK
jgi:CMP-N-acetylneuraminic acid synthetase